MGTVKFAVCFDWIGLHGVGMPTCARFEMDGLDFLLVGGYSRPNYACYVPWKEGGMEGGESERA